MSEAELLSEADVRTTTVKHPMAKRKGDPCTMVIFGGAGDLTKRKLIPALCNLAEQGFLPQQFAIIAVTYTDLTTETFRQQLSDDIKTFALRPVDPDICKRLVEHTYYVRGDFADQGTYDRSYNLTVGGLVNGQPVAVQPRKICRQTIFSTWPSRHAFLERLFAAWAHLAWRTKRMVAGGAW